MVIEALPGARIADEVLRVVTSIRLDATLIAAYSGKELAKPNSRTGYHPLLVYCR